MSATITPEEPQIGVSEHGPFCDATHGLKGFVGSESADHGSIAELNEEQRQRWATTSPAAAGQITTAHTTR